MSRFIEDAYSQIWGLRSNHLKASFLLLIDYFSRRIKGSLDICLYNDFKVLISLNAFENQTMHAK